MSDNLNSNTEVERQHAFKLAQQSYPGSDLRSRFGPGTVGQHELWDRLHVFQCMWSDHIASHPAMAIDPEGFAMSERVGELIGKIYQRM